MSQFALRLCSSFPCWDRVRYRPYKRKEPVSKNESRPWTGKTRMTQGRISLCLATEFFYPMFTGAGVRFQRYAPGLRARGIDMRVFTSSLGEDYRPGIAPEDPRRRLTTPPVENLNGLWIQRMQLSQGCSYATELQYARALDRKS